MGASNWNVKLYGRNLFLLCDASLGSQRHPISIDPTPLQHAHCVIVTSLPGEYGSTRLQELVSQVNTTVNTQNGSVLLPLSFGSHFFDLLEFFSQSNIPTYVVSGKAMLMTAGVCAEYLSTSKRERAYAADAPFRWNVRHIDPNDGQGIAVVAREKCIVFAEHSSLRMGYATALLELMGQDSRNALLLTDPHFDPNLVVAGLRLKMRVLPIPVDIRATAEQLSAWIHADAHSFRGRVLAPLRAAKAIRNAIPMDDVCTTFKLDDICKSFSSSIMTNNHATRLKMTPFPTQNVLVAPSLSVTVASDASLQVKSTTSKDALFGFADVIAFANTLSRLHGISAIEYSILGPNEVLLALPTLDDATVLLGGGTRTVITTNNSQHRRLLQSALMSSLSSRN